MVTTFVFVLVIAGLIIIGLLALGIGLIGCYGDMAREDEDESRY